ncbi:response regulator [Phaeodactylibacter luteus]|uniref:Response regulator n=1 Tax=Phaeodactylibacter luteus TaxID=1564516 RepID=A0A5C6S6S5_9BACT|nr:response regulator [Phaeodactylibacter luteus]TXB70196.1 response regulator [Phaeodactylibacter luteus]
MISNQTKILIIEDNPADITLIRAYLDEARFKYLLYASDSLGEGIDLLWEHNPDLVLLDLNLLDVEGFKTLQLFREKAPDVPVIVMTGFKNEIMGIQSVRAGAQDFLVKGDFDSRSLVRTIRYSLQRFEAQARLQEKAEELIQKERRNRLAHQIARFGRWEMNIIDNSMKWEDDIFDFFGFPPNSFSPSLSEYLKYVHVEDKAAVEQFFETAIKDGESHNIRHRIVINNTKIKHLLVSAQVSYVEKDNSVVLMGSIQDVSGQQPAAPPKAKQPLAEEKKPEVIPPSPKEGSTAPAPQNFNFASSLLTPVSGVMNYLHLLGDTPLNERQQELLQGATGALENLTFALHNWTALHSFGQQGLNARVEAATLQEILSAVEFIRAARASQINAPVKWSVSQKLPEYIKADKEKLGQILFNLVEIGTDFGLADKEVTINIGVKGSRDADLKILLKAPFNSMAFPLSRLQEMQCSLAANEAVALQGEKEMPFAAIFQITAALKGKVELLRKTSRKAEVRLEVPILTATTTAPKALYPPSSPTRILLAEDHELSRLTTREVLSQWSPLINVDTAKDGQEAVEAAQSQLYHLILMDLQMPALSGIEAAIQIRKQSDTPILALTATASQEERDRCRMVGINSYLAKPVRPEHLLQEVSQLLA